MIQVKCLICENSSPPVKTEFSSKLVSLTIPDQVKAIAEEIVPHLANVHPQFLIEVQKQIAVWSSFLFLNEFAAINIGEDESVYEAEKERMRDMLVDAVMNHAPDEPEDELEDEETGNDEDMFEDGEEDEDEDEE